MYIIFYFYYYQFIGKSFTEFIPDYNKNSNDKQIKELEKKLNNEILRNKKLEEENKILKEENMIFKNELNNNNNLKLELDKIINENKKLKNDLLKANKALNNIEDENVVQLIKIE